MVVYHTNRLHKGVNNRWSDKFKTFFEKSVAELFGKGRKGWNSCHSSVFIDDGFVVDKAPTKSVEATILFLDSKNRVGICDSGMNLQLITNNAFILKKRLEFSFVIPSNRLDIEVVKSFSEVFALIENRSPAKSCLHRFQGQSFEECLVIVARNSPFVVMVIHHLL